MKPMTQEAALEIAERKARIHFINADERDQIIKLMERLPIAQVKAQTGRSYKTLLRIAEVSL